MGNKKTLLEFLKPHQIAEQEQKLRELRASEDFVDIQIKSRAPKGAYCDNCANLTTKYEPRICSWNGKTTDVVSSSYCSFFNSMLIEDKNAGNGCCAPCIKCFACLIQTCGCLEDINEKIKMKLNLS